MLVGGMRPLEHFVLTNLNVHRDDADRDRYGAPLRTLDWLEERFVLFERFCLPSVIAQTCQEFEWLIGYDDVGTPPRYRRRLRAYEAAIANLRLVPEPISFRKAIATFLGSRRRRLLTTRLDSDDALHRSAVDLLQRHSGGGNLEFLSFPVGYCYRYPDGDVRLFEFSSNPFLSLVENFDGNPPRTAVCISHGHAGEVAPVREISHEPGWLQVIHGRNLRNRLQGRLCRPPDLRGAFNVGGELPNV